MSATITAISSFLARSDAERAEQALRLAGIECTLRAPGDELPPGWRREPTDLSFTIWAARERLEAATAIIQESWRDSGDGPRCGRCGAGNPTVHLTVLQEGPPVTTHLCKKCHSESC